MMLCRGALAFAACIASFVVGPVLAQTDAPGDLGSVLAGQQNLSTFYNLIMVSLLYGPSDARH